MAQNMRRKTMIYGIMVIWLLGIVWFESFEKSDDATPTVVVVDAETNQPIEGAVAIAIWRRIALIGAPFWEGGSEVPRRIEEVVSDKEGKIFIKGFWPWGEKKRKNPHLTIYKPGYVCWDQERIFPKGRRTDFDEHHRTVKIEKWKEWYSFDDHDSFVGSVTYHQAYKSKERLFLKAFEYEQPFRLMEREQRRQRYEKLQKEKKGGQM